MKLKLFIIFLLISVALFAQKKGTLHSVSGLSCKTCHSCDIPTKENPCIKPCPRENMVTIDQTAEEAPEVLTIDRLKNQSDLYKPVIFSHRLHAEMSGFGGQCKMCHHYNPPGKVVGCSECHESTRKRTDISRPDLKGAYHQQCMNCHRQWSGKVECESCHALKNSTLKQSVAAAPVKTKKTHPKITAPTVIKYETPKASGKIVTFSHSDHAKTFSIDCEKCHSNQSCSKCHAKYKKTSLSERSVNEKHALCSNCHNVKSNCSSCHANSVKAGFNHKERTGFDLNKNHAKLTCDRCHTAKGQFAGLKSDCSNCHGVWTKDKFKHDVTGLRLDEIHSDFECAECHHEKNYANPSCKNCHDDKSYPKDKPGKLVKK